MHHYGYRKQGAAFSSLYLCLKTTGYKHVFNIMYDRFKPHCEYTTLLTISLIFSDEVNIWRCLENDVRSTPLF